MFIVAAMILIMRAGVYHLSESIVGRAKHVLSLNKAMRRNSSCSSFLTANIIEEEMPLPTKAEK